MNSGWVFIMYSSSAKLDKKQIYQHSIVRENGEQCKYQDRARRAVFNKRSCKFYDIDKSAPPKKLYFKVDSSNYYYTSATWKNHFIILVDKKQDKKHILQYTLDNLTERVLFYFQSIYYKNAKHIKNVTPYNFKLKQ
jgi:hypothetical protein